MQRILKDTSLDKLFIFLLHVSTQPSSSQLYIFLISHIKDNLAKNLFSVSYWYLVQHITSVFQVKSIHPLAKETRCWLLSLSWFWLIIFSNFKKAEYCKHYGTTHFPFLNQMYTEHLPLSMYLGWQLASFQFRSLIKYFRITDFDLFYFGTFLESKYEKITWLKIWQKCSVENMIHRKRRKQHMKMHWFWFKLGIKKII